MDKDIKNASGKLKYLLLHILIIQLFKLDIEAALLYFLFLYFSEAFFISFKYRNYVEKIYENEFYKKQLKQNNKKFAKWFFNRMF